MKKFNSIDVLVVFLIILIGVVGYKYLTKDDEVVVTTGKYEVTFIAQAEGVLESTIDQLKVGDQLIGIGYYDDAYIAEILIEDSQSIGAVDGELILFETPNRKNVTVKISGQANKYGPYIDLGGQEIKGGANYTIRTEAFEAMGQILTIVENEE